MKRDEIVARDKRFVWHPYTQMKRYVEETDPFVIASAEGAVLTDVASWYLKIAKERCAAVGALLIIDEVFTGYGRTGTFCACEQAAVSPDVLCTAKAFSGGMFPMAATLVTEAVYEAFLGPPERAFYCGHSFAGNPLGARVALEVLDVMRDEDIVAGVALRSALIAKSFQRLSELRGTVEPRTLGMIGAVDLSAGADISGAGGLARLQRGASARRLSAPTRRRRVRGASAQHPDLRAGRAARDRGSERRRSARVELWTRSA